MVKRSETPHAIFVRNVIRRIWFKQIVDIGASLDLDANSVWCEFKKTSLPFRAAQAQPSLR
jgi:hypothetical protein